MTQLDDLQGYVNLELPRRRVLLTVAIAGYDGDPNAGSAPAVLKGSPVGTWYLRETPLVMYEKLEAGDDTWTEAINPGALETAEDLTFEVDYNDAGAAEIAPGTLFKQQSQIDDYLAEEGATTFKYLQEVFDTIPATINHIVSINLAVGVHRPKTGGGFWAWSLEDRDYGSAGGVKIYGASDAEYTDIVGSQAVTGYSNASWNPYLDFAPATFPNDGSLIGLLVVISTGQISIVHDHTDSRLYVCHNLSPNPTGGTARVAQPGTVLRNSYDDVGTAYTWGTLYYKGQKGTETQNRVEDVLLDPFTSSSGASSRGVRTRWYRCIVDQTIILTEGKGWSSYDASIFLNTCSRRAPVPAGTRPDEAFWGTNYDANIYCCVFMAGDWGISVDNAVLQFTNSVMINAGTVSRPSGSINIGNGANLISYMNTPGKQAEIRGAACAGIVYESGSIQADAYYQGMMFRDCVGPCIKITSGARTSFTRQLDATRAFVDGGGNLDVGVEFIGSFSSFHSDQYFSVTGALGDVRMKDGTIVSYEEILADDGISDSGGNIALRDS